MKAEALKWEHKRQVESKAKREAGLLDQCKYPCDLWGICKADMLIIQV